MLYRDAIIDYIQREKPFQGIVRELDIKDWEGKIISIVGPRRAGKTYYMLYLLNNKYRDALYLNFENIFLKRINAEEFFDILKIFTEIKGYKPKTLLLDEIQELKDWESLLRTLLDYGYKLIVTGSSSKLLGREVATQLRGRSISYLLLPFSFTEFLRANGYEASHYVTFEERGKVLRYLDEYIEIGGYPEVVLSKDNYNREKILRTYYDEIFLKDFVERHRLRNIELASFLFEYIFQNYSNEISINRIYNYLKSRTSLSKKTIYSYLEGIRDTLGVFFLEKYAPSVYVRKSWPRKAYIVDIGLARPLQISKDIGKKMENIVFLELIRRSNLDPLMNVYYYKDYQHYEVDFVIKKGMNIKELIQVTYASNLDEIDPREIKGLIKAAEKTQCKNLRIITWDLEDEISQKNNLIKLIPLWKWLITK